MINYRRAREIKSELDELAIDYEAACAAGNFSEAQDLKEARWELENALFLTGVTSEYDL